VTSKFKRESVTVEETLYIHLILDIHKTKFKTCSEMSVNINRCEMFLIKLFVLSAWF